jgi:hypothetical protein
MAIKCKNCGGAWSEERSGFGYFQAFECCGLDCAQAYIAKLEAENEALREQFAEAHRAAVDCAAENATLERMLSDADARWR